MEQFHSALIHKFINALLQMLHIANVVKNDIGPTCLFLHRKLRCFSLLPLRLGPTPALDATPTNFGRSIHKNNQIDEMIPTRFQ